MTDRKVSHPRRVLQRRGWDNSRETEGAPS